MAGGLDLGTLRFKFDADVTGATNQLQGARREIEGLGTTGKNISKKLTQFVSLPLAGLGAAAIKTTADFEYSMAKVQATLGVTKEEVQVLTDKAKELGKSTQWSASEVADGFNYMAMAGWDTEQQIAAIEDVLNLATATGTDLARTSDIVTDGLTALGLSAEDAGRFCDVFAAASSNANTNTELLGETFKYAAPVAGALGIELEDLAVATGLMANAGIKGGQAGTALRAGLSNLVKPTCQMAAAMEKYGVQLVANEDGTSNLQGTVDLLRDKLGGLEKQEQASAASTLFGKEAMSAWLSVINASERDVDKLKNAIKNAEGTTKSMSDTMSNTATGDTQTFKSAIEGLMLAIGEHLIPIFRDCIQKVTEVVNWFGQLDGGTQKIIIAVGGLLVVLPPLIGFLGSIGTFAAGIGAVGGAFGALATGIAPVLAALGIAGVAIGGVVAATKLFGEEVQETEQYVVQGFDSMVDGIEGASDKTKETVKAVHTDIENLKYEFEKGLIDENGVEKDKATLGEFKNNVTTHFDELEEVIRGNHQKQLDWFNENKQHMTEEEVKYWETTLENERKYTEEQVAAVQAKEDEIRLINDNYNNLSVEDKKLAQDRIKQLLDETQALEIEQRVNSNAELKALSDARNLFEMEATAQNASNVITASAAKRDAEIKSAEEIYLAKVAQINSLDTIDTTAREKLLEDARIGYQTAKSDAQASHNELLNDASIFNDEMLSAINISTGEILSAEQQKQRQLLIEQYGAERVRNMDLQGTLSVQGDLYDTATGRAITSVSEMATAISNSSMAINGDLSSISPEAQALADEFKTSFKGGEAALDSWVSNLDANTGTATAAFGDFSRGNNQTMQIVKHQLKQNGLDYVTWEQAIKDASDKSKTDLENTEKANNNLKDSTAGLASDGAGNVSSFASSSATNLQLVKTEIDNNLTGLTNLSNKTIANKTYTVTEKRVSVGDSMHGNYTGIGSFVAGLNSASVRNAFNSINGYRSVIGNTGGSDGIATSEITRKLDEVIQAIREKRTTAIQIDGTTIAREIAEPISKEILWRSGKI